MTQKKFILMVVLAFLGLGLLFTQDSVFADAHKLNTVYVVVGIVSLIGAVGVLATSFLKQKKASGRL